MSPAGIGQVTETFQVDVGGPAPVDSVPLPGTDHRRTSVEGVEIEFESPRVLPAGVPLELQWAFRESGGPFTAMQPYLSSVGHLVIVRPADGWVQHVHPINWASSGPTAVFGIVLPEPGRYVLWVQLSTHGRVQSLPVTVDAG